MIHVQIDFDSKETAKSFFDWLTETLEEHQETDLLSDELFDSVVNAHQSMDVQRDVWDETNDQGD